MFVKRAVDKDLKSLEAAFNRLEKAFKKPSVIPYVRALDEFYDILMSGAGNEVAKGVLRTLRARMNYLRILTSQASDEEHISETNARMREIVDAALRRDGAAMAKHCRKFVERSAEYASRIIREHEDKTGP